MGIPSQHHVLLNLLDRMINAPYFATHKPILQAAEELIIQQENEILELKGESHVSQKDTTSGGNPETMGYHPS